MNSVDIIQRLPEFLGNELLMRDSAQNGLEKDAEKKLLLKLIHSMG